MYKHRIVFVGAWLLLAVALFRYPGFEAKGFVSGMILGLPLMVLGPIGLMGAPLLCGVVVGVCGRAADVADLSKVTWVLLLLAILAGGLVSYGFNDYSFEDWKNSPAIMAAEEAGELNYTATRQEYHERIAVPKTLAGAMWGLYLAAASIFFYSLAANAPSKRGNRPGQLESAARLVHGARKHDANAGE